MIPSIFWSISYKLVRRFFVHPLCIHLYVHREIFVPHLLAIKAEFPRAVRHQFAALLAIAHIKQIRVNCFRGSGEPFDSLAPVNFYTKLKL